jgi:hypothetical protein
MMFFCLLMQGHGENDDNYGLHLSTSLFMGRPRTDTAQFAWIHGFHGPELVMGCALLVVSFSLFISADAVLFLLVVLYYVIASQILSRFFLKKNLIRNVKNIATSSVL